MRTPRGTRQRILLNLGTLAIPPEEWKELANRIEALYLGQQTMYPAAPHLESLAQQYADLRRQQEFSRAAVAAEEAQWETVDLASLSTGDCRTVGGAAVAWQARQDLGLSNILKEIGFAEVQIQQAALLVSGRLLQPGRARETATWAKEMSALEEILGADCKNLANNALHRLADLLVAHRAEIEVGLARAARDLFSLGEKIILYDLTNTYLAGRSKKAPWPNGAMPRRGDTTDRC